MLSIQLRKLLFFLYFSFELTNNLLLCTFYFAKFHSCGSAARLPPYTGHHWQRQSIMRNGVVPLGTTMTGAFWRRVSQAFSRMRRYHLIIAPIIGGGSVKYFCVVRRAYFPPAGSCVRTCWLERRSTSCWPIIGTSCSTGQARLGMCAEDRTKAILGSDVFLALSNNYSSW